MPPRERDVESLTTFDAGPLSEFLAGFREWLVDAGRFETSVTQRVHAAGHLGYWMKRHSVVPQGLDVVTVGAFAAHLSSCRCPNSRPGKHHHTKLGAKQMVSYLRRIGGIDYVDADPKTTEQPLVLLSFFEWMRRHRGVTELTLVGYGYPVRELLAVADGAPITIGVVRRFILERSERVSLSHAKTSVTAIRMFVRHLILEKKCSPTLLDAIPKIANWRLAGLPQYLSPDAVQKLLDAPTGGRVRMRDRAILLLLVRLGLRAGDACDLKLDDIDWARARLMVTGKSKTQAWLPLCQEVGDAILAYIEKERPESDDGHVFLAARRPRKRITPSVIGGTVRRQLRRAGLPAGGAHRLRHTAATDLLRQGMSLEAIGVVLRHQSVETTALYAKVEFPALKSVVQRWPGA